MTNLPPQPGGWIDGSGTLQPGHPPPGHWQANDGRWYPPDLSSASTRSVAPTPPPYGNPPTGPGVPGPGSTGPGYPSGPPAGQYPSQPYGSYQSGPQPVGSPPGFQPASASGGGSKTGLYVALGALVAIVGLAIVAAVVVGSDGNSVAEVPRTTAVLDDPEATPTDPPTSAATTPAASAGSANCARLEADYVEIDFVNDSTETSNYVLTIIYRDDAGNRVADDSQYVNALRPGERSLERHFVFGEGGTQCEVAELDRVPVDAKQLALAESATCEIIGEDFVGDAEAKVTVTNNGSARGDFAVEVAVIDSESVRRGSAYTGADAVAPGESAPSDAYTSTPYDPGLRCEVITVSFYPSS